MNQVAEYYAKVPTDAFAEAIMYLGNRYNNALVVIENNSVGLSCLKDIEYAEYENVYFSRKGDLKPGKAFNLAFEAPSISEFVPGFTTSRRTRPLMLQKLEEYIRTRQLTLRSNRILEELKKFIWKNGKPQAQTGYNDDLVIAAAIACWVRDTFFAQDLVTDDTTKAMINAMSRTQTDQTEIPGGTKDPRFVRNNERLSLHNRDPYVLTLPDGNVENLGWLIGVK